jgi:nickel transport protein
MNRLITHAALAWACALAACHGHGITATPVEGGVGVRAAYDDGTPVSFSEARVFAPGAPEKPALVGTTDRHGCFLFRPDTNGVWKVTVDDGMGHVATEELRFEGQAVAGEQEPRRMSRRDGVITGLALIFGVFGWSAFARLKLGGRLREQVPCTSRKES